MVTMVRRVTVHHHKTIDNELLPVITIFEPGINKEQVKKINRFSKRHHVLVKRGENYEMR